MNCPDEETRSVLPLPRSIPTQRSAASPQKHLLHLQFLPRISALQHSPPCTQHAAPRTLNSITPPGPHKPSYRISSQIQHPAPRLLTFLPSAAPAPLSDTTQRPLPPTPLKPHTKPSAPMLFARDPSGPNASPQLHIRPSAPTVPHDSAVFPNTLQAPPLPSAPREAPGSSEGPTSPTQGPPSPTRDFRSAHEDLPTAHNAPGPAAPPVPGCLTST